MTTSLRCQDCGLQNICFPPSFDSQALQQLEQVIDQPPVLAKHAALYQAGDTPQAVYAVRAGHLMTTVLQADGSEQITGFYQPGEVVGLENLGQPRCVSRAVALERSSVCTLPTGAMSRLARELPALQQHLFQIMSTEIRADYQRMHLMSASTVEARLAGFLVGWLLRQQQRRLPADSTRLPMNRSQLGNHLGVTLESVSRAFSKLDRAGILTVSGKSLHILDPARLNALAAAQCA